MSQSQPFSRPEHRPDLPDFRELSSAARSRLAEAIWERFVAAHPESAAALSGQALTADRPSAQPVPRNY
ncbi:MAG: hypothetical protein JNM76_18750 [Betaproteobacteria bacterium]|nr:hypothetical protein [Betaproteobacteria bacterium]